MGDITTNQNYFKDGLIGKYLLQYYFICNIFLIYAGVGCGNVRGQPYDCTDIDIGGVICQDQCPNGQDIPGITPLYQTCSMYGMWDEAVKYSYNINPDCSGEILFLLSHL